MNIVMRIELLEVMTLVNVIVYVTLLLFVLI